jgi:hypothetical protein
MSRCDAEGHCITCSDEALPMRVIEILADGGVALCEGLGEGGMGGMGGRAEVLIGLVGGVAPGEVVLVHAGAALARVGEGTSPAAGGGTAGDGSTAGDLGDAGDGAAPEPRRSIHFTEGN